MLSEFQQGLISGALPVVVFWAFQEYRNWKAWKKFGERCKRDYEDLK